MVILGLKVWEIDVAKLDMNGRVGFWGGAWERFAYEVKCMKGRRNRSFSLFYIVIIVIINNKKIRWDNINQYLNLKLGGAVGFFF